MFTMRSKWQQSCSCQSSRGGGPWTWYRREPRSTDSRWKQQTPRASMSARRSRWFRFWSPRETRCTWSYPFGWEAQTSWFKAASSSPRRLRRGSSDPPSAAASSRCTGSASACTWNSTPGMREAPSSRLPSPRSEWSATGHRAHVRTRNLRM